MYDFRVPATVLPTIYFHKKVKGKFVHYPGRWQSPHMGHRWLIERRLNEGKNVCIMIRDVEVDENNPFTAGEVHSMLSKAFKEEIEEGRVVLWIIPDMEEIVTGRGVGYKVTSLEETCPPEVKRISATEIRRQIRAGEDGWRSMVMPGVEADLEAKFNDSGR